MAIAKVVASGTVKSGFAAVIANAFAAAGVGPFTFLFLVTHPARHSELQFSTPATSSPRASMFSLENAVYKDSYRRIWQQHRWFQRDRGVTAGAVADVRRHLLCDRGGLEHGGRVKGPGIRRELPSSCCSADVYLFD